MPERPAIWMTVGAVSLLAIAISAQAAEPEGRNLRRLVLQDCGSCHGMTLEGGLGPAITPAALQGRDPAELTAIIREGRPARAMPGWGPLLAPGEAERIAAGLLDGRFLKPGRR